jgi:hypothetical protein
LAAEGINHVDSVQALEEIERLQHEFGPARVQIPDPVERWWYDVTRIEFDTEAQAIRLVCDQ